MAEAAVTTVACDLTTEEGAAELYTAVPETDVLVGSLGSRPPLEITDEEWRTYFDTNVVGAVRLIRHHLPSMTGQGWGRVPNIAGDSAIVIPAEMIHYGMSKTVLLAVSRGFAQEAAGTGVTVNSVTAGPTHTGGVEDFVCERADKAFPREEARREFMRPHRPQSLLQRLIEPAEIAAWWSASAPRRPRRRPVPRYGSTADTPTRSCPERGGRDPRPGRPAAAGRNGHAGLA